MDQDLARYLNKHLAGASGALWLIQELVANHDSTTRQHRILEDSSSQGSS